MEDLWESVYKIKRYIGVKNGKKTTKTKKVYATECKEGYKRDSDGNCVRMSSQEQRNRSIAANKAQSKSSTKRNREIAARRAN